MKKGFTLIELLVVIAIIGLLSAVVLAALSSARTRGRDTAIKSELVQVQRAAALYADANNGSYGSVGQDNNAATCITNVPLFGSSQVSPLITSLGTRTNGFRLPCAVSSNGQSWALAARLEQNTGSNTGWCVDSSGSSKAVAISFTGNSGGGQLTSGGVASCP